MVLLRWVDGSGVEQSSGDPGMENTCTGTWLGPALSSLAHVPFFTSEWTKNFFGAMYSSQFRLEDLEGTAELPIEVDLVETKPSELARLSGDDSVVIRRSTPPRASENESSFVTRMRSTEEPTQASQTRPSTVERRAWTQVKTRGVRSLMPVRHDRSRRSMEGSMRAMTPRLEWAAKRSAMLGSESTMAERPMAEQPPCATSKIRCRWCSETRECDHGRQPDVSLLFNIAIRNGRLT